MRLEKLDMNQVRIKLWAEKKNSEYALCKLFLSELKHSSVIFQVLFQHSTKPKHKSVADIRFSNTACHLYIDSKTSSLGEKKAVKLNILLMIKFQLQKVCGCLKLLRMILI